MVLTCDEKMADGIELSRRWFSLSTVGLDEGYGARMFDIDTDWLSKGLILL